MLKLPSGNILLRLAPCQRLQVTALWAKPTGKDYAKTPFLLLQAICALKGWQLTVRHEAEVKIGAQAAVSATVNVPGAAGPSSPGRSFTAVGKHAGAHETVTWHLLRSRAL